VAKADKNSLVTAQSDERERILEAKLADAETRSHFLGLAKITLADAVNFNNSCPSRLPEFIYALSVSDGLIQRAEAAVSKYARGSGSDRSHQRLQPGAPS